MQLNCRNDAANWIIHVHTLMDLDCTPHKMSRFQAENQVIYFASKSGNCRGANDTHKLSNSWLFSKLFFLDAGIVSTTLYKISHNYPLGFYCVCWQAPDFLFIHLSLVTSCLCLPLYTFVVWNHNLKNCSWIPVHLFQFYNCTVNHIICFSKINLRTL